MNVKLGLRTTRALVGMVVGCGGSTPLSGDGTPPDGAQLGRAGCRGGLIRPGRGELLRCLFGEAYCSGCYQPSFVAPSGDSVAIFSNDPA